MSNPSYKAIWVLEYKKNQQYYEADVDPFDRWESLAGHASIAELHLDHGLRAWYGDAPETVVRKFLHAAIEITNRAESEKRFETGQYSSRGFPMNRGRALRTRAYATALLESILSKGDLVQASVDFEEWCKCYTRGEWDSQGQANYLAAVRTALIAEDRERFGSLLNHKWTFNWHQEEHAVFQAMSTEFQRSAVIHDPTLTARFRTMFDTYRNPDFKPDIFLEREMVRFELGAMWCKNFSPSEGRFKWHDVIDAVSS